MARGVTWLLKMQDPQASSTKRILRSGHEKIPGSNTSAGNLRARPQPRALRMHLTYQGSTLTASRIAQWSSIIVSRPQMLTTTSTSTTQRRRVGVPQSKRACNPTADKFQDTEGLQPRNLVRPKTARMCMSTRTRAASMIRMKFRLRSTAAQTGCRTQTLKTLTKSQIKTTTSEL